MDYEYQPREARKEAERPDEGPSGSVRFKRLRAPVGVRHGKTQVTNNVVDQQAVMAMLDQLSVEFGGNRKPDGTLEVWWPLANQGKCDIILWTMILRVQNHMYAQKVLGFKPDGVVDPGGRTEYLMQFYAGSGTPMPASNPKELAKAAIPLAMSWIQGASAYLEGYKRWRSSGMVTPFDATAANVHLHLDKVSGPAWQPYVAEWMENYRMIADSMRNAEKIFIRATREEALAARNGMQCWGVTIPAWARAQENIWFGPDMIGLGPKCKAAILIHEAAHYIRVKLGHQGGERGPIYDNQTADQALTSAYVCANFATHAATGRDERFGLARSNE